MKKLQATALGRVPLTRETVEDIYDGSRSGTVEQCLKALCESHERLRMELEGCQILVNQAAEKFEKAAALTDTGRPEFKAAFPPKSAMEGISPKQFLSGWRVVEKIREVLLS